MAKDTAVLMGVGEISLTEGPMEPYSALVRPTLATADIRFAQCERLYSERGTQKNPELKGKRAHPKQASVYKDCGFDVASVANNHGCEWGLEALLETLEVLPRRGNPPCIQGIHHVPLGGIGDHGLVHRHLHTGSMGERRGGNNREPPAIFHPTPSTYGRVARHCLS